jgi:hypothetical protein
MKRALMSIFVALLIVGVSQGTLLQNVKPGNVNIDLGDGYKASFNLPNAAKAYDVETDSGYSDILKFTDYNIYIREAGSDEDFLSVVLRVFSEPQLDYITKEASGRTEIEGIGTEVRIPRSIDGANGYVFYGYPEGNAGTNINEANGAAFHYYPKAIVDGDDLKSIYEVLADTYGAALTDPRAITVFQSILDSIHVSGV